MDEPEAMDEAAFEAALEAAYAGDATAAGALRRLIAASPSREPLARACNALAMFYLRTGDPERGKAAVERGIVAADPESDLHTWVRLLNFKGYYALVDGEVDAALEALTAILVRGRDSDEPDDQVAQASGNLGELVYLLGDSEGGLALARLASRRGRGSFHELQSLFTMSLILWMDGRGEEARPAGRQLRDAKGWDHLVRYHSLEQLISAFESEADGQPLKALQLAADLVSDSGGINGPFEYCALSEVQLRAHLQLGQLSHAAVHAEDQIRHAENAPGSALLVRALRSAIDVAAARGDMERVLDLARRATDPTLSARPGSPSIFVQKMIRRHLENAQVRQAELATVNTALMHTQTAAVAARDQAVARADARMRFLAHMSHELRTPLHGVIGTVDLLQETPLSEEQQGWVQTIARSAELTLAVVDDVLDLGRIEAGEVILHIAPFQVGSLVRAALSAVRGKAAQTELIAEVSGAPHGFVAGDARRIQQVLVNLLGNAIKYAQASTIRARAFAGLRPHSVRFEVVDDGIGIPEKRLDRLFEAYTQARVADRDKGTGLGLAICRSLVEQMGGSLEVSSEVGYGTRFAFELELPQAIARPEEVGSAPSTLDGLRILLAEDNATNRMLLRRILESLGAVVVEAEDGERAVERGMLERPDVVLMDLHMPGLDGNEATLLLRERGFVAPILALTASVMESDRQRCLEAGMDGFLSKPVQRRPLLDAIHGVCELARRP